MICVDVIVPCYNYGHFLHRCVQSVLDQQGVEVRVLIVDDCSPDGSAEIAFELSKSDVRVTFRRHLKNQGHIATYNEGIEWLSAPYYLLLSADDYLLPGALQRSVTFMEAHPTVGLAFGQQITLHDDEVAEYVNAEDVAPDWTLIRGPKFIEESGARNCVPTPCAVVRTALQKRIGGYREDLPHSGDMEMWLRIAAQADVATSQASHAVYRRHAKNMSLAYTVQHWLPDIQQRKRALDSLLQAETLPKSEAVRLHNAALRELSMNAVSFASMAFNAGDLLSSSALRAFALDCYPEVWRTGRWLKLTLKRLLTGIGLPGVRPRLTKLSQGVIK